MFPNQDVEAYFSDAMAQSKPKDEGYWEAAQFLEKWLIGLDSTPEGFEQELQAQKSITLEHPDQRMQFAMAMAISLTNESLTHLVDRHRDYLRDNRFEILNWIYRIRNLELRRNDPIDILKAFRLVRGQDGFETLTTIFDVNTDAVMYEAIAWDDDSVFKAAMYGDSARARASAMEALTKFSIDPDSKIYKALIFSEQDKKDLFFHRMAKLREIRFNDTVHCGFLRPEGDYCPSLFPGNFHSLNPAKIDDFSQAHEEKDFRANVLADPHRLVADFFYHWKYSIRDQQKFRPALDISQAFLNAGISGEFIINHGLLAKAEGKEKPLTPQNAIIALGQLSKANHQFYSLAFKDYLSKFTVTEMIACINKEDELLAIYRLMGDREILRCAGDRTKEKCLNFDLGL